MLGYKQYNTHIQLDWFLHVYKSKRSVDSFFLISFQADNTEMELCIAI